MKEKNAAIAPERFLPNLQFRSYDGKFWQIYFGELLGTLIGPPHSQKTLITPEMNALFERFRVLIQDRIDCCSQSSISRIRPQSEFLLLLPF